jgi:hypothetical protein
MTNVAPHLPRFHYSDSENMSRDDCVAWQTVRNLDADLAYGIHSYKHDMQYLYPLFVKVLH